MLSDNLAETDINRLPYFVTNAQTGGRQNVTFAPLLPEDEAELRGPNWSRAVFRDVWLACMGDGRTLKLLCTDNLTEEILGLVRIGSMTGSGGYLWKSLLEAAPSCRTGTRRRKFAGVGRVLVARLVAESLQWGGAGKVNVAPRPGSEKFYGRLGFRKGKSKGLELEAADAARLLTATLWERQGETNGQ